MPPKYPIPTALLCVFLAGLLVLGCEQPVQEEQSQIELDFVYAEVDQELVASAEALAAALEAEEPCASDANASKAESCVATEEVEEEDEVEVKFAEKRGPILRFKTREDYEKMVIALETNAELGDLVIEVPASLSEYVDSELYLAASELSYFNHEGKIIIGDTLYALAGTDLEAKSLSTNADVSYPLDTDY